MPRPRNTGHEGTLAGAILGGLLAGWPGAILGGALGHTGDEAPPVPLEDAIRQWLEAQGATLVSLHRFTHHGVQLVVNLGDGLFWRFDIYVAAVENESPSDRDDRLYDAALAEIREWKASRGL